MNIKTEGKAEFLQILFPKREIPIYTYNKEKDELIDFSIDYVIKKKNTYENLLFQYSLTSNKDEFPPDLTYFKNEKKKYLDYLTLKLKKYFPKELLKEKFDFRQKRIVKRKNLEKKVILKTLIEKEKEKETKKVLPIIEEEIEIPKEKIPSEVNDFSDSSNYYTDKSDNDDDGDDKASNNE